MSELKTHNQNLPFQKLKVLSSSSPALDEMKGCLQWQQMLCVQWPYGDSLECVQHFTRHRRPTYWPNAPIQRKEQKHADLWDRLSTGKRYFGHRENLLYLQHNRKRQSCKQLFLSILCCWFVIERQRAEPIEGQCGIDLWPIWEQ